jgi:dipeptidase E
MGTRKSKPIYLFAGGLRNDPTTLLQLYRTVFTESGVTAPSIAYIGTANRDVDRSYQRAAERLKNAGASTVTHALLYADTADIEKAQTILNSADLIFVSGGDVAEGMRVLNEKKMIPFLHRLHEEGKPFFGISAGSIMLSKQWVRWSDPNDDSTATLFPCLGFAPILCDTHGEDDDWEELQITLKLTQDDHEGYGIVSGAAIKVYPNGTVEALGHPIHRYVRRESSILRISDLIPLESQSRTE